ncbi:MAG: hypothetical protein RSD26_07365 [Cellulosilyticaceae bacterium]
MNTDLDYCQLQPALNLSRELIYKDYLNNLNCISINNFPSYIPIKNIRFLKVVSLTCPTSNNFNSFVATLYALWSLDITLCYILQVSPEYTTVYFGVSQQKESILALNILKQGLSATYPSIVLEVLEEDEVCNLLNQNLFNSCDLTAISSATLIPTIPSTITCSAPLLTPFLESMKGSSYTLVLLASSMSHCTYQCLYEEKLQTLYNTLFPFREVTYAHHHHNTNSCTDGTSCSQTENQTTSESQSKEANSTENSTCSTSQSLTLAYDITTKVKPTQVSTKNNSQGHTDTSRCTDSDSCSNQNTRVEGCTQSKIHTSLDIQTTNYRYQDIKVTTVLAQIERLLTRYTQTSNLPIFNFNTYFLSKSPATCIQSSANYINLLEYKTAPLYPSFMNTWLIENPSFNCLLSSLSQVQPPTFYKNKVLNCITPALPITSLELNALLTPPPLSNINLNPDYAENINKSILSTINT